MKKLLLLVLCSVFMLTNVSAMLVPCNNSPKFCSVFMLTNVSALPTNELVGVEAEHINVVVEDFDGGYAKATYNKITGILTIGEYDLEDNCLKSSATWLGLYY